MPFKKLHIGCGHIIKPGWLNQDIKSLPGVDIVFDLRKFPWPFRTMTFDYIYANNVLEHLPDFLHTMEEIYRITRPSGKIFLGVPFWNSYEAWGDPTHVRAFSEEQFEFFDPSRFRGIERSYYSKAKFGIRNIDYYINPLKPAFLSQSTHRFGKIIHDPFLKKLIRFFSIYFCNIIHGLDVYLERL